MTHKTKEGRRLKEAADDVRSDEELSDELRVVCSHIKQLDAEADTDEVQRRFEAAVALHEALNSAGQAYGEQAIPKLAEALAWSAEKVRLYNRVAEVFDADDVAEIIADKTENSSVFTWSHLVVLSGITDGRTRLKLRTGVLAGKLSVRDLKSETAAGKGGGGASAAPTTATAAIRQLIAEAKTVIVHSETRGESWPELIADEPTPKAAEKILAGLQEAREQQARAAEVCGENVDRIDECLTKVIAATKKAAAKTKAAKTAPAAKRKSKGKPAKKTTAKRPATVRGMDTAAILESARANEKPGVVAKAKPSRKRKMDGAAA